MEAVRVLLVTVRGKAREAYLRRLDSLAVEYDVVESVDSLETSLLDTAYNGVLLDVPTVIRSSAMEKAKVRALLEYYPVMRIRYLAESDDVHGLTDGQTASLPSSIEEFIQQDCARFQARAVRAFRRCSLVFNALLINRPDSPLSEAEKAYTVNVSETGCFIATVAPPPCGQPRYLVLCELTDKTPIPLDVRWRIIWGEAMRTPGFGARFLTLTESQKLELVAMLATARNTLDSD